MVAARWPHAASVDARDQVRGSLAPRRIAPLLPRPSACSGSRNARGRVVPSFRGVLRHPRGARHEVGHTVAKVWVAKVWVAKFGSINVAKLGLRRGKTLEHPADPSRPDYAHKARCRRRSFCFVGGFGARGLARVNASAALGVDAERDPRAFAHTAAYLPWTITFPVMCGCSEQKYSITPTSWN